MPNELHLNTNGADPYVFSLGDVVVYVHVTASVPVFFPDPPPVGPKPIDLLPPVVGPEYPRPPMRITEPVEGVDGADELLEFLRENPGHIRVNVESVDQAAFGQLVVGLQGANGPNLHIARLKGSQLGDFSG